MNTGVPYYLINSIYSLFAPYQCYGRSGELVRLIAEHGNVAIVEGSNGRFPVKVENIMEATDVPEKTQESAEMNSHKSFVKRPVKRSISSRKKHAVNENLLFT